MGFFSWNCKVCGKSIIAPYHLSKRIAWMNDAVIITEEGNIHTGPYSGYGEVGNSGQDLVDRCLLIAMFHRRCWEAVEKPMDFPGASPSARDQGYFYAVKDLYLTKAQWEKKVEEYLTKHPLNARVGARR